MVGRYVRKSNRQSWSETAMQEAIKAIQEKKMGWLKASKTYNVPQATLRRRASNKNKRVKGTKKGLGRYYSTFDEKTETELVQHIQLLESRLFGLTTTEVRLLAYEFAETNKIKHRFNREKKIAGKEWLRGFRVRNPQISLRQPEPTSAARARAFNKPQVSKFFEVLHSVLEKESISIDKIYNVDESGLSTVQKPPKILASTGRKQVGSLTSAERGQHVSVVCCVNAVGNYIPPAMIFSRKNRKDELFDKAPPGTLGLCQESGWMTSELFIKWLKHFSNHANPSPEKKALLLLDGHVSHKSLEAVSYCRENNIIIMCFPAHCTHRMQPLDVSFFGPLKSYYNQACTTWLRNHPGRVITAYQVSELFSEAYGKAATVQNALSGFTKTGISPLDPDIFPDHLFVPADTTDVPPGLEDQDIQSEEENMPVEGTQANRNCLEERNKSEGKESKSGVEADHSEQVAKISFLEISPPPKVSEKSKRRKRETKYTVLTCSPNVEELKNKAAEKQKVNVRGAKRKIFNDNLKNSTSQEAHYSKMGTTLRKRTETSRVNYKFQEDNEECEPEGNDSGEDDVACIYCNDTYNNSRSRERWIKCVICHHWAHLECTDLGPKSEAFICDLCS